MTKLGLQRGFAPFKRRFPKAISEPVRAVVTGLVTPIRFSLKTGHWKSSMTMTACTESGEPLPWYTYPAIDFLAQRSFASRTVLEFGGGQSTLWWSKRAGSVLTIEEDAAWYARLRSQIRSNVTLFHIPADDRIRAVDRIRKIIDGNTVNKFDVIVVDGHFREQLTTVAFECLAPDGAIILDDSDGYRFFDITKGLNCRRIDFFGFAPGVSLRRCTSIGYVSDCFLLKPDIPIPIIELAGR
jgi:hypothetical protein